MTAGAFHRPEYADNLRRIRARRNEILRGLEQKGAGGRGYSGKQVDYAQARAEREILAELDAEHRVFLLKVEITLRAAARHTATLGGTMPVMTATRTIECSVRPAIRIRLRPGQDAGPIMEALGDALEHDPRALGVGGVACDYAHSQLSSTFQVAVEPGPRLLERVHEVAAAIAADAIASSGISAMLAGIAVVEGDDPDQLP